MISQIKTTLFLLIDGAQIEHSVLLIDQFHRECLKLIRKGFILFLLMSVCPALAAPQVEVTGILVTSKGATAIINGKCYAQNDSICGGKITAIEKGGVTIQIQGKTWEFPVSGPGQVRSSQNKSFSGFLQQAKARIEDMKKQKLSRK